MLYNLCMVEDMVNVGKEVLSISPQVEAALESCVLESLGRPKDKLYEPYAPIVQDVILSGFGKCQAHWEIGFGGRGARWLNLSIMRGDQSIADVRIDDRWDGGMEEYNTAPHYFDVRHRIVHRGNMTQDEKKIRGVGKYALHAAEASLQKLLELQHKHKNPNAAAESVEIGMLANQPSVMGLARSSGYEIRNPNQNETVEKARGEIDAALALGATSKEYAQYVLYGVLPNFRMVNIQLERVNYVTTEALIDLQKLREYCASSSDAQTTYGYLLESPPEPTAEEMRSLADPTAKIETGYLTYEMKIDEYTERKDRMRSQSPHPFFLDAYFF